MLSFKIELFFAFLCVFLLRTSGQQCIIEFPENQVSLPESIKSRSLTDFVLGGNYKPERTDIYQGTNDSTVFPVLVVFVKFPSGEPFPQDFNWPAAGDPVFLNNIIASHRNNDYGLQWWDAYS